MGCERLHWELPGSWELCPRRGHHNASHPFHLDWLDTALCNAEAGIDSTGPALSLRPRPQPGGPSRAGLALLAPSPGQRWETQGGTGRRWHWGCGASRVAAARNARQVTGVCLPNRVCGAPERGLGVDGGTVDGDRRKPLEESGPGGEKKGAHSGGTWDPDGKDRRWPKQGRSPGAGARHLERLWRQTPRTALSWVDQAGPGHQTPQITHHFPGLQMPLAAESENRLREEINATPLWAA